MNRQPSRGEPPILTELFAALRGAALGVALFSGVVNLLALTGALFMLQVYDRVLTSRSVPTLVALTVIVVGLYAFQGILDLVRSRLLVRIASQVDAALGERAYRAVLELPLRGVTGGDGLQPIRDLDTLRAFLSGPAPLAILDLPWMPLYLGFIFLLHPLLGLLALAGAIALLAITMLTEWRSKGPSRHINQTMQQRLAISTASRRNAEVLRAMGFGHRIAGRWLEASAAHLAAQQQASDVTGGLGAVAKVLRMLLQSGMLALGAYLVIIGEVSAGVIIASSIAASRALAPIDLAIANWRSFVQARQSHRRLAMILGAVGGPGPILSLPPPCRDLSLENVTVAAPGMRAPLVQNVSLRVMAGQGLGVIGPSGAGKSSLVRAMVGAWPVLKGQVRIDGATLDQWDPAELGRHIGYLPQDVELFDGTVADNIARFDDDAVPSKVLAAAMAADVHEMILRLPEGYATRIGEDGAALSAGQRQRIGLARALYGDPFLVVLDEPNSNLDAEGELALTQALEAVRARGGIVVVVAHRPSALAAVDHVAVLRGGMMIAFGSKDDVVRKVTRAPVATVEEPGHPVLAEATPRLVR